MRWVLLLRGVNVGTRNKLAMRDLAAVLTGLGHTDVTTYLNSGNATFHSIRRSPAALAEEVEAALQDQLGLAVRAGVRSAAQVQGYVDAVPERDGYALVTVLLERPAPAALRAVLDADWSPEVVTGDDQVLYLSYRDGVHTSRLQNARLEKLLGVACTARTPATLRRLL